LVFSFSIIHNTIFCECNWQLYQFQLNTILLYLACFNMLISTIGIKLFYQLFIFLTHLFVFLLFLYKFFCFIYIIHQDKANLLIIFVFIAGLYQDLSSILLDLIRFYQCLFILKLFVDLNQLFYFKDLKYSS
jgi:hypothetical protein